MIVLAFEWLCDGEWVRVRVRVKEDMDVSVCVCVWGWRAGG